MCSCIRLATGESMLHPLRAPRFDLLGRLGTVQPYDVPQILDEILERQTELSTKQHSSSTKQPAPPLCPVFWRGRMGLDKDGQLELAARS